MLKMMVITLLGFASVLNTVAADFELDILCHHAYMTFWNSSQSKLFWISKEKVVHGMGKELCFNYSSTPAVPEDDNRSDLLKTFIVQNAEGERVWFGIENDVSTREWVSFDNKVVGWTNWDVTRLTGHNSGAEPDGKGKQCGSIMRCGQWHDRSCDEHLQMLCMKMVSQNALLCDPNGSLEENDQLTLNCHVVGIHSTPTVAWFRNGVMVFESTDVQTLFGNMVFVWTIEHLQATDSGNYTCLVSNNGGNTTSNVIELDVQYSRYYTCRGSNNGDNTTSNVNELDVQFKPKIIVNTTIAVQEGNNAVASMTIMANPASIMTIWAKSSINGEGKQVLNGIGSVYSFIIPNISLSDSGSYMVFANNTIGNSSTIVFLDVLFKPKIMIDNTTIVVQEGEDVNVSITIQANPPSIVAFWSKDSIYSKGKQKLIGTNNIYSFTITNISFVEHGTYVVFANNTVGYSCETIFVSVSYAPKIHYVDVSYTVKEGGTVVMGVNFSSNPKNVIFNWTVKWIPSFSQRYSDGIKDGNFLFLEITNASREDSGPYRVTIENEIDKTTSINLSLNVIYPPRIMTRRTIFHLEYGLTIILRIEIQEAHPPVDKVVWYKNNRDDRITISINSFTTYTGESYVNPSLNISNMKDSDIGSYICNVSNEAGFTMSDEIFVTRAKFEYMPIYNRCRCIRNTQPINSLDERIKEISKSLQVEYNKTSKYNRRLSSQSDDRTSSQAIGYVGILVICVFCGTLLLFDIMSVCQKQISPRVGPVST